MIVVDDGSRDETPARLAELAAQEPRLRVVAHGESRGVAQARNAGIRAARGEWVAFLDDDDLWSPQKLRAQIDAARAAGAAFAYAAAAWLDERHRFLRVPRPPQPEGLAAELLHWNVLWAGCSNVIAQAALVRRLGGFDERLFQLADWDLWIRLALAAPAACCDDVLVGYVMHPESMLLTDRRDVFLEFDRLVAKHADAARAHGVAFDAARFSRWVALGHLRAGRRRRAAATYARGALRHRDPLSLARAAGALLGPGSIEAGRVALRLARAGRADHVRGAAPPAWLERYGRSSSTAAE